MRLIFGAVLVAALAAVVAAETSKVGGANEDDNETVLGLTSKRCYNMYLDGKFGDVPCMKLTISKLLGLAIITGSLVVKAPQIYNIFKAGNVEGLAPMSTYIELSGLIVVSLYNIRVGNPVSTYGESAIIAVQNVLLVFMLWGYAPEPISVLHKVGVAVVLVGLTIFSLTIDMASIDLLMYISIIIAAACRIPQVYANAVAGHTGVLAFITLFMNLAGTAARVFTSLQEVKQVIVLYSYVISAVLNAILVFQALWYWKATNAYLATKKKKQE